MGLYVEVMCDERKPGNGPYNNCWSDRNDNPQGRNASGARAEAREQGWKIGPGNRAVCPACRAIVAGDNKP
jgi:hypothetical protein